MVKIGRLRTLSSTHESRKFSLGRKRNGASTLGVLHLIGKHFDVNASAIYHDVGQLELLILRQGDARARAWDRR